MIVNKIMLIEYYQLSINDLSILLNIKILLTFQNIIQKSQFINTHDLLISIPRYII